MSSKVTVAKQPYHSYKYNRIQDLLPKVYWTSYKNTYTEFPIEYMTLNSSLT